MATGSRIEMQMNREACLSGQREHSSGNSPLTISSRYYDNTLNQGNCLTYLLFPCSQEQTAMGRHFGPSIHSFAFKGFESTAESQAHRRLRPVIREVAAGLFPDLHHCFPRCLVRQPQVDNPPKKVFVLGPSGFSRLGKVFAVFDVWISIGLDEEYLAIGSHS